MTLGTEKLADFVQRHDPDRYFCTLFAPAHRQPVLFVLYAFNHELARAHEAAREPGLALIRLQWWREVVEGAPRSHEVAKPLAEAIAIGALPASPLLAMIEAREAEVEAAETLPLLTDRLTLGPGSLAAAAGAVLGADDNALQRFRTLGAGVGLAGLIRNIPAHARLGRCQVPADVLARHQVQAETVIADPQGAAARAAISELADHASSLLGPPKQVGRAWAAAGLPAVLARRDLRWLDYRGARGLGDKLAVASAALRGSV